MPIEVAKKVRVDDTLEMGYYIDDFTDPWKEPDTMILQTGNLKPRQLFYAWIPTLARYFRVIRPHLRGHWDSTPAPEGYRWTVKGLVDDLKHFLDALGLDKVHFVGESLGGLLALHLAYHYPECLKTLTIVTAPACFKNHPVALASRLAKLKPGEGISISQRVERVEEFGPENRALLKWFFTEVKKNSPEASKGYYVAASSCEVNVEEFLPKLRMPTLLMMGAEHTRVLTIQQARHFCDLMPRAKLVAFPGVKAQCQFVIPDKCAKELLRFIKEQAT